MLFFKCIYILSLLHAMCHSKGRMSDCFIWTNNKVKLLLKVCIEYKTSKDKAVFPLGWPPCCFVPNLKHHRQESWTLDECPHASKKYRIYKFQLWRADSKVSIFASQIHRMHVDKRHIWKEKYTDSKVSGYIRTGPKAKFTFMYENT